MTSYGEKWSEHQWYKRDPLPGIKPALLNSRDIQRYVDKECLLDPKRFKKDRMKPASYELRLLGTLYWWEERKGELKRRCQQVGEGDRVMLLKNSISYLWTEEPLRLPEYIAARFNLRIRDVHKGILLGTGPLIDPGFGGRLLIPLHNLTHRTYPLEGGDGIVWVEFTKVSPNKYWVGTDQSGDRPDGLAPFPTDKILDSADRYFKKAEVGDGVQSAFKGELESTRGAAQAAKDSVGEAEKQLAQFERRAWISGMVGAIGVVLGVAALLFSAHEIHFSMTERVRVQSERLAELERIVQEIEDGTNEDDIVRSSRGINSAATPDSDEAHPADVDKSLKKQEEPQGSGAPASQRNR